MTQKLYRILGIILGSVGIISLLMILLGVVDELHIMETIIFFGSSVAFLMSYNELEKQKKWENADDVQRILISQKQKEKDEKERKCGNIILAIGIGIILVLCIIAIVL